MNSMMSDFYKNSPTAVTPIKSVNVSPREELKGLKHTQVNKQMDASLTSVSAETVIDLTKSNGTSESPVTPMVKKVRILVYFY